MGSVSKKRKRRYKALAEAAHSDRPSSDSPSASTSSLPPGPHTAAATGSCTESSLTTFTLDYYRVDSVMFNLTGLNYFRYFPSSLP